MHITKNMATNSNQRGYLKLLQIAVPCGIAVGLLLGWNANGSLIPSMFQAQKQKRRIRRCQRDWKTKQNINVNILEVSPPVVAPSNLPMELVLKIVSFVKISRKECVQLPATCKDFHLGLKLPKLSWTSFPQKKYKTLNKLMNRLNELAKRGKNVPSLLFVDDGVHKVKAHELLESNIRKVNILNINIPISIIGESREHCIVMGGLQMNGKKEDDVNVSNLTLRGSKGNGVCGDRGACIHLDNVSVEYSKNYGVVVCCNVSSTYRNRNTMKNCNVSRSKGSGLVVGTGALLWYDGGTTVHHNFTDEDSAHYGVHTSTGRMIDTHGGGRYLIPSVNDTIIHETYGLGNDTDSLTVGCGIYISPSGDNNRYTKLSSVGGTGHAGQWYT